MKDQSFTMKSGRGRAWANTETDTPELAVNLSIGGHIRFGATSSMWLTPDEARDLAAALHAAADHYEARVQVAA